jgi:hypothetical protein
MDIDAIRARLSGMASVGAPADQRVRAARKCLINRGVETLQILPRPGISLDEVIRAAIGAPPSEARREFAVLLVIAIGIDGLLVPRGETERLVQSFLEQALLNPLRRAGYPFDGTAYDKRQALAGLHATIDEHLRPFEPSIPRWIHGVGQRSGD